MKGKNLTFQMLSLECLSLGGPWNMKEEYNNPWLLSPPSHRIPSCHRVTSLQLLSYLLFSRVAALFPPLQVRGIGLAASSGHGVTWVCSSACPQLVRQVREHLSWLLVLSELLPRWALGLWSLRCLAVG